MKLEVEFVYRKPNVWDRKSVTAALGKVDDHLGEIQETITTIVEEVGQITRSSVVPITTYRLWQSLHPVLPISALFKELGYEGQTHLRKRVSHSHIAMATGCPISCLSLLLIISDLSPTTHQPDFPLMKPIKVIR